MSDSVLRLDRVSHSFGAIDVLRDITLEIERGEFVVIVGPSGCGKTTLLNLISGFHTPVAGSLTGPARIRTVYQSDGLLPWMTVAENIAIGLSGRRSKAERSGSLLDLMALVRLEGFADHYPYQISPGMRQRAELARALGGETDILLLDEPFSSLDYQTRLLMRRELSRILSRRPCTVMLVTHDIEEAAQLGDRIVVFSGRPARQTFAMRLETARPREPTDEAVITAMKRVLDHLGLLNDARRSWNQSNRTGPWRPPSLHHPLLVGVGPSTGRHRSQATEKTPRSDYRRHFAFHRFPKHKERSCFDSSLWFWA